MEINHQVNHGEKHPQHWRSCKLIVDPALKNGFYKVYRYDGHHFNMPVSKFNFRFLHLVVLGYLLNVITDTVALDLNFLLTTHFFSVPTWVFLSPWCMLYQVQDLGAFPVDTVRDPRICRLWTKFRDTDLLVPKFKVTPHFLWWHHVKCNLRWIIIIIIVYQLTICYLINVYRLMNAMSAHPRKWHLPG